ncbi:hypothetical protein KKA47_05210, partial [bacterium]|nr:hypothetical protein [bacterium]
MVKKIIFILLLTVSANVVFAETTPEITKEAMRGQELIFKREYDAGIKIFKELEVNYPKSPAGLFGQIAIWQLRMFENEDMRFADKYRELERKSDGLLLPLLRDSKADDMDLLIAGSIYGMRGFFAVHERKFWDALTHGLHAVHILKRLRQKNPNFPDGEMGIGMYEYWRSVFTTRYWFLPFFADLREEGVKKVKLVANEGKYIRNIASGNLAFIFLNQKRFEEALAYVDPLLNNYPNNVVLTTLKGRIFYSQKKYKKAAMQFEKILRINSSISKVNYLCAVSYFEVKKGIQKSKYYMQKYIDTDPKETEWLSAAYYWMGRIS